MIEYLRTPPSRATVLRLIGDAGLTVRAALRQKDTPFAALGLDGEGFSDDDLSMRSGRTRSSSTARSS